MTIHVRADPLETVDANSAAGEALLSLAASIEVKMSQCAGILLDNGYAPAAQEVIASMIATTSTMRALVVGQTVVSVE